MEITNVGLKTITVQVERKIVVGKEVRMFPSYGYCGIENAKAEVKEVVLKGGLYQSNYKDLLLESSDYLQDIEDLEEDNIPGMVNQVDWVIFEYTEGHEVGEVYAFPLELFVDHSHPVF